MLIQKREDEARSALIKIGEYDILSEPMVSAKKTVGLCAYARIEKILIFFWFWQSFASVTDGLLVEC